MSMCTRHAATDSAKDIDCDVPSGAAAAPGLAAATENCHTVVKQKTPISNRPLLPFPARIRTEVLSDNIRKLVLLF
jgi:hypothetical protein